MSCNTKQDSQEALPPGSNPLSELVHDIRHCLHVLKIGRELLSTVEDPDKRREVCDCMILEEKKATELLDELVAIARGRVAENREA